MQKYIDFVESLCKNEVETVEINDNMFGVKDKSIIMKSIKNNTCINSVEVCSDNINKILYLYKILNKENIKKLTFVLCRLNHEDAKFIKYVLNYNSNIKSLTFKNNRFSELEFKCIASILKCNTYIKELNIQNSLPIYGNIKLVQSLIYNKNIKKLSIFDDEILIDDLHIKDYLSDCQIRN